MTTPYSPTPKRSRRKKPAAERRALARSTALNTLEAQEVDTAASESGISVSAFLREVALEAARNRKRGSSEN